ncbi:TPA: protease, partial [Aeromonas salmonicida subsp. masoucida]
MMTLLLTTLALAPLQCELSVKAHSRVNEPLPLVMTLTNKGE